MGDLGQRLMDKFIVLADRIAVSLRGYYAAMAHHLADEQ